MNARPASARPQPRPQHRPASAGEAAKSRAGDVVDRIAAAFGGQRQLADAIGDTQSTVAHWKRRGTIPARKQQLILQAAQRLAIPLAPADFFPRHLAAAPGPEAAA